MKQFFLKLLFFSRFVLHTRIFYFLFFFYNQSFRHENHYEKGKLNLKNSKFMIFSKNLKIFDRLKTEALKELLINK